MSSTTTPTPIEQKINDKNDGTDDGKQNNWVKFGIDVLTNFITTLVIGLIGANFIYLSTADEDILEKILPTKLVSYFPSMSQKGGSYTCSNQRGPVRSLGLEKFKFKFGWPYNLKSSIGGLLQSFKNWFAETVAGSYIINRGLLRSWINLFAPGEDGANLFSSEPFQILIVAPLTLLAFPLALFFGFFSTLYSAFNASWVWTLIGILFAYTWLISTGVSVVQFVQYMVLFLVFPLLSDLTTIKKILQCNTHILGILFGALVISSAFSNLDNITSIVMFVAYLLYVIKSFW
jgi:hypothetical protein